MKNIAKSAAVLACIAFVSGLLLAVVNKLTYVPFTFSLTGDYARAVTEITDSTAFEVIEHEAISANPNVRVVLRAANGSDNGKVIISANAVGYQNGGSNGLIESLTMFNADGSIAASTLVSADRVGNNYWGSINTENFYAAVIGLSEMADITPAAGTSPVIDGVVSGTAPFTFAGLYNSVKNALDYNTTHGAAIKSAAASDTVTLGELPTDPMLEIIQQLYPEAREVHLLGETDEATNGDIIKIYSTENSELMFVFRGIVLYEDYEGDIHDYMGEVAFKVDSNGLVDKDNIIYIDGMNPWMTNAANDVDGVVNATGSKNAIIRGISKVEALVADSDALTASNASIKYAFELADDKYLIIGEGMTISDSAHWDDYSFVIAFVLDGNDASDFVLISTENYEDYMNNAMADGEVTPTASCSKAAINALVNIAKSLVGGAA